ncbi:MAG: hypothetical protein K6V36_11005, partial [Anaerolineae bacterium]|nr:hypothetical protein [Anaerolineae bacterium]
MTDETVASEARRYAAEVILQDEALTADLEDAEADALLRWAVAIAEDVVMSRLRHGLPLDRDSVAEALRPLRQILRAVNDLAAHHTDMPGAQLVARLLALLDAVWRLACLPSCESQAATRAG